MEYRRLGRSGLVISRYVLGTAFFGSQTALDASLRIVARALELGVNVVDTANTYGDPRFNVDHAGYPRERPLVEEIVGRAIAGHRSEWIVATKVCEPVGSGPNQRGLSRRFILAQCELSLRRLGTDYVDLYYAHHPDPDTPIEESLRAFDDLVHQGKVRYVGISNFAGWQIAEAVGVAERRGLYSPVVMQMNYNLLSRGAESEQLPALAHFGLGSLAFAPLAGGILAGRYHPGMEPEPGSRGHFWRDRSANPARPSSTPILTERFTGIGQALAAWAHERGHSASQVALAWLLGNPMLTGVISGASTIAQLEESVGAVSVRLTEAERQEVAALAERA